MQEVCSSIDPMGPQIKSESPINALQQQQSPSQLQQPTGGGGAVIASVKIGVGPNCDKRMDTSYWMGSESGFINSQPSMAEFLTHLSPESPKLSNQAYPVGAGGGDGMDGVPEYPWMKEKKTARKNNSQGSIYQIKIIIIIMFLISSQKVYIYNLYSKLNHNFHRKIFVENQQKKATLNNQIALKFKFQPGANNQKDGVAKFMYNNNIFEWCVVLDTMSNIDETKPKNLNLLFAIICKKKKKHKTCARAVSPRARARTHTPLRLIELHLLFIHSNI